MSNPPPNNVPSSIGPYPIERELGRGGMGVVYLGRDPRLNRPIAIKVLPEEVARDPMRLSRFEREARTLAALNHKNVGLIYGLEQVGEQRLLVLEFIPGVTLTARLARGAMPLDEAFRVCMQMAEGLEAAHEREVVHRDLKPDNLKITPDGTVKILDFGLATTRHSEGGGGSESATIAGGSSGPLTQQGMVMGTPGYMSPEQARGLPMDKRTDIWAFGCVLFECLSGTRAFNGLTASDMLVAVIEREPDFNALPARTPGRVRELLRKCLVKDARRRLRDVGDARNELEDVLSQPQSGWYRAAPGGGIGGSERPRTVTRLSMTCGEEGIANAARSSVSLSPDGQTVAFIAGHPPQTQLYVRRLDNPEPLAIPGTSGAEAPFFSPDGHKVAFFEGGKLKRVSLTGGAATVVAAAPRPQGGCWAEGDFIYFIPDWGKGLARVAGGGGPMEMVAQPDMASGELALLCPEVLPTGNAALVAVWTGAGYDAALIVAIDLRTGQRRPLVQGGMNPRFASSGHLVFTRLGGGSGALFAVAFDPERLEVFGQPMPIEDKILGNALGGAAHYDIGGDGALVYAPGAVWEPRHVLLTVGRAAAPMVAGEVSATQVLVGEQRSFVAPAVSPDGTRLAVQVQGTSDHIYLYDLGRTGSSGGQPVGAPTRLTFHGDNGVPVWSPDGTRLAFRSNVSGQYELYWMTADGAGAPALLFSPASLAAGGASVGGSPAPCGFSRDGRHLIFTLTRAQGGTEIWMVAVGDPASARPIVQTSRNAWSAGVSPDGKYVAFACDETGREEVYLQQIPAAGAATMAGRRQVTPEGGAGGNAPLWLPGASGELAYRSGDQLIAVRVATEPSFMVGRPRVLAQVPFLPASLLTRNFDSMPDAQRFVIARPEEDRSRVTQLNVVLNWFDDLRRRVPVPLIAQPTRIGVSHSRLPGTMTGGATAPAAPIPPNSVNTAFTEAATMFRPGTNTGNT